MRRNSTAPASRVAPSSWGSVESVTGGHSGADRSGSDLRSERVLKSDSGLLPLFLHEPVESNAELRTASDVREWKNFLLELADDDPTLFEATRAVRAFWDSTRSRHPRVPLPVTSKVDDGLELVWRSHNGKYVDLQVSRDGRFEWLYRDSRNDVTRTSGGPTVEPPSEFIYYLTKYFVVE